MTSLASLLGSFVYVMTLAVINGSAGYICAVGVTVFGALGVAKLLGESIALSYAAIASLAVLCGVLRGFLRYLEQYSNHYIAFKLLAILRDKIFKALRRLAPAKLETKGKGGIISMLTADIETLEVFYAHTVSPIAIAVLTCAAVFVFVCLYASPYLALTALAGYLAVGLAAPIIANKALRRGGADYRGGLSSFNSYFLDSIRGIKEIVFGNTGGERKARVNARSDGLIALMKKQNAKANAANAATQAIMTAFIAAALIVGGALTLNYGLSVGRMIVGLAAVVASFGPVLALSALPANLSQTFASGDRALNLLAERPAAEPVKNGKSIEFERLDIDGLTFGYDGGADVLKGVSLTVKRGEIVGLTGGSGCGKSTLLKLLLGFWQRDGGSILYNGIDLREIDAASLSKNVTMVSQTTYLFDETIEYNLKIAKPDASREELAEACKKASIHDFILTLPDGYDARVGALGDRLSAGERQRIGLARAFLRGAPLILLDEPTSNVDAINEGIILKALKEQRDGKAIIIVSHRESTSAIADRTYKMQGGVLSLK
jgi:ATP-binding cassette subfamily C protein